MLGESSVIYLSTVGILMSSGSFVPQYSAALRMHSSGAFVNRGICCVASMHHRLLLLAVTGYGRAAAGGWHRSVHGSCSQECCGPNAESPSEEQRGTRDWYAVPPVVQVLLSPLMPPSSTHPSLQRVRLFQLLRLLAILPTHGPFEGLERPLPGSRSKPRCPWAEAAAMKTTMTMTRSARPLHASVERQIW